MTNSTDNFKQTYYEGTDQPCMESTILSDHEGNVVAGQIRMFNRNGIVIDHVLIEKDTSKGRSNIPEYKIEGQTHLLQMFLDEQKRIKKLVN